MDKTIKEIVALRDEIRGDLNEAERLINGAIEKTQQIPVGPDGAPRMKRALEVEAADVKDLSRAADERLRGRWLEAYATEPGKIWDRKAAIEASDKLPPGATMAKMVIPEGLEDIVLLLPSFWAWTQLPKNEIETHLTTYLDAFRTRLERPDGPLRVIRMKELLVLLMCYAVRVAFDSKQPVQPLEDAPDTVQ